MDLPDISGTHLHPADMSGAIVSIDRSEPIWHLALGRPPVDRADGSGAPGRLAGVTLAVEDPGAARRWAEVLGVDVTGGCEPLLRLDGGEVAFGRRRARPKGLSQIAVAPAGALPSAPTRSIDVRRRARALLERA